MNDRQTAWLVAKREMRERSRSGAFRASLVVMVVTIAAVIIVPAALTSSTRTVDVGLSGVIPAELSVTLEAQAKAVGTTAHLHRYDSLVAGEAAVRKGDVDVLVVDARNLEWPRKIDERLRAVVSGAIQLVAVRERAAAAGIDPDTMLAVVAPVPVKNVELSKVAGRSRDDEIAAVIMTGILLFTISVYGGLVLGGVVEEKASRVVEVLLARIPARSLLAGKVAGIGLLGLAQICVTALAALIAVAVVGSFNVPAVRAAVVGWVVVWFVLGYVLYATLYGALGSLASRPEDAQSVVGPAMMLLVLSYFAAFTLIAQPASAAARAISFFPTTAPLAMPGRIAMGATLWWEPIVAVLITLAAIAGLVYVGGRLYEAAVLHSGPTLSLREAWRVALAPDGGAATADLRPRLGWLHKPRGLLRGGTTMTKTEQTNHRLTITVLTALGVGIGIAVAVMTSDVIIGVIVGSLFIAISVQMVKLWTGHSGPTASEP